jgi:hypothetical protein
MKFQLILHQPGDCFSQRFPSIYHIFLVMWFTNGRKHIKTWMPVVEECCGMFQVT